MDVIAKGRKKMLRMEEEMRGRRMMDPEFLRRGMFDKGMGMGRHGMLMVDNSYKVIAKYNDDLDDKDEKY